jgi:hypothetical protein
MNVKIKQTYFSNQLVGLSFQHQLLGSCKQTVGSPDAFQLVSDLPFPKGKQNQWNPRAVQTGTPMSQQKPN